MGTPEDALRHDDKNKRVARMTLKQKREIARRFIAGETIHDIACWIESEYVGLDAIEQVLRDFMMGRFRLEKTK